MDDRTIIPETLTVEEVAACAALTVAQERGYRRLAQDDFAACMTGLFDAIDEGPLSEPNDARSQMALLAATWILASLPDDTRIPICPSLRHAQTQDPNLLGRARRFLAGQAVSVRSRGPAQK